MVEEYIRHGYRMADDEETEEKVIIETRQLGRLIFLNSHLNGCTTLSPQRIYEYLQTHTHAHNEFNSESIFSDQLAHNHSMSLRLEQPSNIHVRGIVFG